MAIWGREPNSPRTPGKNILILCRQHHCSWWCSRLDWLMQKHKSWIRRHEKLTPNKKKNINPRGQAWESASNAIQTQKRAPKITISKKQKRLWDIRKNASKSRCEPEIPYHKLWPLIQIADLQLKTKNPKNSKPSPQLQPPFAIEDLGLQPTKGCSCIVLQKTNKLSLQAKTLI